MSLNPSIGHLYHDFSISNDYVALDVKEKFKTRQINAREDKQLGKYNKTLERAKTICKRRREWEEFLIRQQLKAIHSRTPSLDRGLVQAEERRKRYEEHVSKSSPDLISRNATSVGIRNSVSSYRTQASSRTQDTVLSLRSSNTKGSLDNAVDSDEIYDEFCFKPLPNTNNIVTDNSNRYIKRSEHVSRALDKVYRRHRERTASTLHAWEILKEDNREILEKARVFLKNTDTLKMLETVFLVNISDQTNNSEADESDSKTPEGGAFDKNDTEPEVKYDIVSNDEEENQGKTRSVDAKQIDSSEEEDKALELNEENINLHYKENNGEIISSVIVNPSVSTVSFSKEQSKWTEIFRMPELWRQYGKTQEHLKKKKLKKQSVTHTGRFKSRISMKDYERLGN